ncbi:MAG: sulfatase [Kordiimonadaceae bacterium]|nr:sulfatase [Kordiimonadaceae bacterium]
MMSFSNSLHRSGSGNRLTGFFRTASIYACAGLATIATAGSAVVAEQTAAAKMEAKKPNIVVIFVDDMGFGDVGVYGHPTIRTPNLNQMAHEGQKWTNFYAAANVCSPSRAGLLTGRLPIRSGMQGDREDLRVLFPFSKGGMPEDELTMAEMLKSKGYKTAAVGKWHLGHLPQYLPTAQGFDQYFGIPYSNDMNATGKWTFDFFKGEPDISKWNVPLMRDTEIVERPAYQYTITKRYTEEAVQFIEDNKSEPFFLYLAHNLPHVPLFASEDFVGKSDAGFYGDVIEEIDWSVGQVLETLKKNNLDENTLVVFTSDNGPWLVFGEHGGSAGLLHDGKGTTFEGGMRVPGIFWWPGKIKPAVIHATGSTLDIMPSVAALTGGGMPEDRVIDGVDLAPVLFNGEKGEKRAIFYYRRHELFAVRYGDYKAHFITEYSYRKDDAYTVHGTPLLYNVMVDPGEKYNVADKYPDIIAEIRAVAEAHKKSVKPVTVQFNLVQDEEF